jgi:hypothetical protein
LYYLRASSIFLAVAVGTDDKGKTASTEKKTCASAEKIEIIRVHPVPITIPWIGFMLIGQDDQG